MCYFVAFKRGDGWEGFLAEFTLVETFPRVDSLLMKIELECGGAGVGTVPTSLPAFCHWLQFRQIVIFWKSVNFISELRSIIHIHEFTSKLVSLGYLFFQSIFVQWNCVYIRGTLIYLKWFASFWIIKIVQFVISLVFRTFQEKTVPNNLIRYPKTQKDSVHEFIFEPEKTSKLPSHIEIDCLF